MSPGANEGHAALTFADDEPESPMMMNARGEKVEAFDRYDVAERCKELMSRISLMMRHHGNYYMSSFSGSPPWKWDILELMEESKTQLQQVREVHANPQKGMWREICEALANEATASTLPVAFRKQCEELTARREMWLMDFDTELHAILARGREIRERLLFEDVDRAGWFSAAGVSALEVQRLLERHLDMHQRASRLSRQLKLLSRTMQQQGALSSRRRAFAAKTVGEKLQSSLVCLAAVAVAPVPGSSEMWLATTTMMWLDKDQAWQHVVYEHPRDADVETILSQFQVRSTKARKALSDWESMPAEKRRNCVLVHNASWRRIIFKPRLTSHIMQSDNGADWTQALDSHPLGSVMKKALTSVTQSGSDDEEKIVIAAQRLAVVQLPPRPDTNWGWRGLFSYGDTRVGDCRLKEGGVFSFICVDCGIRVGDRDEVTLAQEAAAAAAAAEASKIKGIVPQKHPTEPDRSEEPEASGGIPPNPFEEDVEEKTNPFNEDVKASADVMLSDSGKQIVEKEKEESSKAAIEESQEKEEEGPKTSLEVVNRTDEPTYVKVFEPGSSSAAARLFKTATAEATVSPSNHFVFSLQANKDGSETNFDVEIRVSGKKVKCEVVGDQVIFIDGFSDS
eukprot:TRINITY_DN11642_c3_g1_i1.p1 TRINITY_DN11642_c3_g1~~TRINITY_DN11642_c3_g1_i1.p1  ORF type:complete len:625 (-),score=143.85 TRINITY_DN11642_c3_g1_i1:40-1914(-)